MHERMRPPILKTLEVSENLRRYKDEVGGLVVARSYVPELEARVVDEEPAVVASLMRDRLLGEWKNYRDCIDYFELLNEVAQTGEDLKRLTEFTVECCRLLNDEGHRVAVGSFSVGNPPDMARDWQTFKPAVYAADAIALHEYGAPYVWSQPGYHNPETLDHNWWCLRYRRVRELMARTYGPAEAPKPGSILLHNERETWQAIQPAIGSSDVERDGHALRLMIAAGAGVPLHFLAEGQDTNVATAREMARPTLRHYGRRQLVVGEMFEDIANEALRRSGRFGEGPWGVRAVFEDLSRRDTEESARATKAGAEGLAVAVERGWITNDEARELFNRFAEFTGEANELSGKARSTRSELEPTGSNGSARADAAANPKNAGS